MDAAAGIGKPVVLGEFGKKGAGAARAEFFQKARTSPSNEICNMHSTSSLGARRPHSLLQPNKQRLERVKFCATVLGATALNSPP